MSLSVLNSKNGILSETNKWEPDYIIPTCSVGVEDSSQCHQHLENGNTADIGSNLQNGISAGFSGMSPEEKAEHRNEKSEGSGVSKKPRDKPQRQRHLAKKEARRNPAETVKHQESAVAKPDVSETDIQTEAQSSDLSDSNSACDIAGSIIISPGITHHASEPLQVEQSNGSISKASTIRLHQDQVPAAPSKPLPVPQPRRFKKPALVRQDGMEGGAHDQVAERQVQEADWKLASLSLTSEGEGLKQDKCNDLISQKDSGVDDNDANAPVPPPRQTSLSPHFQRSDHSPSSLNKNTSHSLALLSQPEPPTHDIDGKEHRLEDEEDGYGDFERYPVTHSLPKQIKLTCNPPLTNTRKAFSAEDQQSPRAPPRKPQRHSLPAPPPLSICPPAPPHANTPMRELPAPPQEKAAWRFTFFSRQMPTRSSVPPKSRTPALGCKQRAQSFSAADLATRANPQKRNLSFRKLLELRVSVKVLPKLLVKGQSLESAGTETDRGEKSRERPKSCVGEGDIFGEEDVEYENVPLYEEIPEYMNLPFQGTRLGWAHDQDAADSDIYEAHDPYHRYQDHEYERYFTHKVQLIRIFILTGIYFITVCFS